jgi:hypothetical protein
MWAEKLLEYVTIPDDAHEQGLSDALTAVSTAGPLGFATDVAGAGASAIDSGDGPSQLPDTMAIAVAGAPAPITVDTPWRSMKSGGIDADVGAHSTIRSVLRLILWLSAAFVVVRWARGRIVL